MPDERIVVVFLQERQVVPLFLAERTFGIILRAGRAGGMLRNDLSPRNTCARALERSLFRNKNFSLYSRPAAPFIAAEVIGVSGERDEGDYVRAVSRVFGIAAATRQRGNFRKFPVLRIHRCFSSAREAD